MEKWGCRISWCGFLRRILTQSAAAVFCLRWHLARHAGLQMEIIFPRLGCMLVETPGARLDILLSRNP